jgi:hypothetical protein
LSIIIISINRGFRNSYIQEKALRGGGQMGSIKRIGLLIVGWCFVVLGIIGLFLPILQGVLFILIGLGILSSRSKTIKRLLKRLQERYPQHYEKVKVWEEQLKKWFKKG